MATVPRAQRNIGPAAAPGFTQQNTNSVELASIGDRQQGQFGQALGGLGGAMEQVRLQEVERANALRVDDALNQAQEAVIRLQHDPKDGYLQFKGYDALQRENGVPLADEYTGKLDQRLGQIEQTLGNDRQRAMFKAKANDLRTRFMGGAWNYVDGQQQTYTLSVREATVKNAADALVINAADPENVAAQTARIRGALLGGRDPDSGVWVPGAAQLQGRSAAWGKEKADEAVSGAHTAAVQSFMQAGNVTGAMAYRKKYAGEFMASDLLKIDGDLHRNYDTIQGTVLGTQIANGARAASNPGDFDRFVNIIEQRESGGNDFNAAGGVLTSPKGAKGRMQVLDSTMMDPGLGLPKLPADATLEQRAEQGRRYLGALLKKYDGDVAKTAAAYNWGFGAVDKAIQERGADWLAAAPAETKAYVANVTGQLSNPRAGASRPTLEQLQQQVRAQLPPGSSPIMVKAALDSVATQFEANTKAIAQRKEELVMQAYTALTKNPRFSDLDPGLRAQLYRDAPDKVDELQNFGVRIAKGDDVTNDATYLRLSNPDVLKNMSEAQLFGLRGQLSQSAFEHFSNKRAELIKGGGTNQPGDLNDAAISRTLNNRLAGLGIDPTPKDATSEAQRVGAIRRYVDASLIDAQRAAGKKFTDAEVQAHVDGLFAKSVTFRTSFLGIPTGSTSQQLLNMKVGDIPSDSRRKIEEAFKDQGIAKPTDSQILGAYFSAQGQAARGATGSF